MVIEIELHDGPLPAAPGAGSDGADGAGAVICFEGVVRPMEQGRPLTALAYEQYPPMTERELRRLGAEVGESHRLLSIHVTHSYGIVPVGAVSFRLVVGSKHRAEGLAAMDEFINRLKREVPLWKLPVYVAATKQTV